MADDEPRTGEAVTANYGWIKPNVGNSDDAWGGMLNADLDGIDTTVKSVSTVANAAYPASNPSGYQTAAQVTAVLPVASSTTPLMDGIAAIGASGAFARADHVHPLATQAIGDNRIINGDMRIDQRNNGASGTATGPTYTIDRWEYYAAQAAKLTWGRNLNAVTGPASFPYYFGFQSSSAYASVAADQFIFWQPTEADFVSDFAWGSSNAQLVTLSFWVRSSLTGTFGGCLQNSGGTRSYPFTYSIPTANTWTKIAITIPGDTAGTWVLSGNAGSLNVLFDLGSGSTYRGPANAWAAANYYGATGAVSVVGTLNATFYVTGVKLEIGSIATPYNRQSLAKSLADCQRYYVQPGIQVTATGNAVGAGYGVYIFWSAPVTMRAAPTVVASWGGGSNAVGQGITISPDNRTILSAINSSAAGAYSANLTITSFSAEL
jgi:hypothetical protein